MTLQRVSAGAGIASALITFVFGALHPKGTSDVGSVDEWMTRVNGSDVWILVHFMLLLSTILALVALVGIARSYEEPEASAWGRLGAIVGAVAVSIGAMTFLIDGAVVKQTADLWASRPGDAATSATATLATQIGFILVAGLQIGTGVVALIFGIAGFRSRSYPIWLAWLAVVAAATGIVPGAGNYLFGASTWNLTASYVSSGLFAWWVLAMSRRLWAMAPRSSQPSAIGSPAEAL
jgi:hypothetical protein